MFVVLGVLKRLSSSCLWFVVCFKKTEFFMFVVGGVC